MDPFLLRNHFNMFFLTGEQNIEDKIVKTNKHFSDVRADPLQSNLFLRPTLPDEIQKKIEK